MSSIKIDLSFEQILEAINGLSEEERERLLFELSPELVAALKGMEEEYDRDRASGRSIALEEL
ncbi:MAG: hypothetical protein ACE5LQ_01050 [Candidatus Bipolaricaulia bacterium]